jgi:hypothetical protein
VGGVLQRGFAGGDGVEQVLDLGDGQGDHAGVLGRLLIGMGGRRGFGNIRKLPSGRFQIRYPGPDGRIRSGSETYERKGDAERALSLVEAQIIKGEWTDPERGKIKLREHAENWISQRPGLRPRTVDLYVWLLNKHITPHLGAVQLGKLSTAMIRQWRADLLAKGVSVSMAAKAYRLLRAVLMTAAEDDHIIPRNPPVGSEGPATSIPKNGPCSPWNRSSIWPTGSAVDRSETSASCRPAPTDCASSGTA